jgi:hypothetical protein
MKSVCGSDSFSNFISRANSHSRRFSKGPYAFFNPKNPISNFARAFTRVSALQL